MSRYHRFPSTRYLRSHSIIAALLFSTGLAISPTVSTQVQTDGEIVTIEIGSTTLPPRARNWFESELRSFEATHPSIRVVTSALIAPWRPFVTTIDRLPRIAENVIGIQHAFGDETQYLASKQLVVPIEDFLPDPDFSMDDFYENSWQSVRFKGKTWGVPLCSATMYLILDKNALAAEGITTPPATWAEFAEYAARLTKDRNGDGVTDQYGLFIHSLGGFDSGLWFARNLQMGLTMFKNGKIDFTQPDIVTNLSWVNTLIQSGHVIRSTSSTFGAQGNSTKQCAMTVIGNLTHGLVETVESARSAAFNSRYMVAPLPANEGDQSAISFGSRIYLAIRRSTPEKEAASWELVKWLTRADISLPDFWFGYPSRKDLVQREDFDKWIAQFCDGFEEVIVSSLSSRQLPRPFLRSASGTRLRAMMMSYFDGKLTTDEMIAVLDEAGESLYEKPILEQDPNALFED